MALTIKRTSPLRARILPTLLMIFALMLQPMYGLVAGQVANAIEVIPSGEFTNPVADYRNAADYKGITVAVRYKNVSGLTGLTVAVNRANGGTVTKVAKQERIDAINAQNGADTSVTAPIIVQQGTYIEAGSSSWHVPVANNVWTPETVPTNVVITMSFTDSSTKSTTLPVGVGSATYAQIAPPEAPGNLTIKRDGTSTEVAGTVVKDTNHTLRWIGDLAPNAVWNIRVTHPDGSVNTSRRSSTAWFDLNDAVRHGHFGTQQGVYKYEVRQQQTGAPYGAVTDWSEPAYLTFDSVAPVINHVSPLAGSAIGRIASFEFNATDSLSGVRNVNLHLMQGNDTKKIVQLTQDGATDRWYANNVDLNSLASGDYVIVSRATDNASNTQFVNSNHGKVTLDKSRPTVTLVAPETSSVKGKLSVQVDATDPVRGLQSITANIYKDGSLLKGSTSSVSGLSASHNALFDLADGTYVIRYNARNSLGNISETKEFTVSVDNTAPKSSNIRYEQIINGNIGGQFRILVDLEDPNGVNLDKNYTWARVHLGGKEYSYAFSKVEGTERTYEAIVNTFDFVAVNSFTPGANITLRFADSLLNGSSTKPKTIQGVGVDNSGPGSTLLSPASGSHIRGSVDLSLGFTDDTGVSSARVRLTNTATGFEKWYDATIVSSTEGTLLVDTTQLPDGEYTVAIRPVDSFGQPRLGVNKGLIVVDNIAPVASINVESPAGTGNMHRGAVRVTGVVDPAELHMKSHWFEITNPDGSVSYSHNLNTSSLTYGFDLDTSKGDGQYKIRYVATDKAGNRNDDPNYSNPTVRIITVDNTAPVLTILNPLANQQFLTTQNITAETFVDNTAVRVVASIDGTTWTDEDTTISSGDQSSFFTIPAGMLAAGSYTLTVKAYDLAGNETVTTRDFSVVVPQEVIIPNAGGNDGTGGESPNTGGGGQPAVFTSPIFAFVPSLTDGGGQAQNESGNNNESEVLGEQDPEEGADLSDTGEVMGIMDHKWLGLAWYWYLVILGALIGGWLLLAGAIRRRREEEEA